MGLLLEAVEVNGPLRWRWLLSDEETGNPVADHPVNLDSAPDEVARFRDLYGYARSYAAPDRRVADQSQIVADAGEWAGHALLGETVVAAIAAAAPVTVRVAASTDVGSVLMWPLELAHADGKPLAARGDVTFVYDIGAVRQVGGLTGRKDVLGEALQVLAVFSQPTKTSVLALRRERYALSRLIRRIAARERAVVQLRVAQYGVTRQRLAEIADSGDGWDVLHLSGHGAGGLFLLENRDGSPDPVSTGDLMGLLRPMRRRVKLAVVSACESAVDTTAETYRLLGLTEQAEALEAASGGQSGAAGQPAATQVPGLARALVRELDCAVIAMRYPVTDEFAIAFGDVLYERLLSRRQAVDVALARAVAEAAGSEPSPARPAVSLATPGAFGTRAAGLKLVAPRGRPVIDPAEQKMAYFPDEPERFVGRAEAMARASAALAPGSGRAAVLLHGMAGAGKTACALELAYRHQDAFAVAAFWQAPTRHDEWPSALPDLANRLDIQLADYGFTMASHIGTVAALEAFLPKLRRALADNGVLLVLDNLETLLTGEGGWRDPWWELLISALTSHDGESRVILTSRVVPAGLGSRAVTLPVNALSLDESAVLARELPNLRALLHADPGPVRAGNDADVDRGLVLRVLRVVQGHPKLLELADAAATDRDALDAQLTAAEAASDGQRLEAFFRDGASALRSGQFLEALSVWTTTALAALPEPVRMMAQFLACIEDGDRQSNIINANWAYLWQRLGRPGDPPAAGPLSDELVAGALVEAEVPRAAGDAAQPVLMTYRMHPGIAAATGAAAGPEFRAEVDKQLSAFWCRLAVQAKGGGEHAGFMVRAALAGAPYLLRLGEWAAAGELLANAVSDAHSPGVIQAMLPRLRRVAEATGLPKDSANLARALQRVDRDEAERVSHEALRRAVGAGDDQLARTITWDLALMLRDAGQLGKALEMVERRAEYTGRAGLGPWFQLDDQALRLQILSAMGEHDHVLAETTQLRERIGVLPAQVGGDGSPDSRRLYENILLTAYGSALAVKDWQGCLDLNAEIAASRRQHGAGLHEIAFTQFNDAGPLIALGRVQEAGRLLTECQQVFEDHADTTRLARVLGMRANLEAAAGRPRTAMDMERAALRLHYAHPVAGSIAIGHHNLAVRLDHDHVSQALRAEQRAHRLAGTLIYALTGMGHNLAIAMDLLAGELREHGTDGLPSSLAEVVEVAERSEGVRLGELLAALQPDPRSVEDTLAGILRTAASPEFQQPE